MTVEELPEHLRVHWPRLREELLAGRYQPQPVRRVVIRAKILGISLALTIALVAFSTLSIPASVAPANSSNVVYGTDGSMVGQEPDLFRQTEPVLRFHNQSRD
jgi:hypothetical protein